jgi:hypothetical protein
MWVAILIEEKSTLRATNPMRLPALCGRVSSTDFSVLITALRAFHSCPKGFSQLPYGLFTVALRAFHSCPTDFSQLPYGLFTVALRTFHSCPTDFF